MSTETPSISGRLPASAQRRDVMWNIIEPGDPYDIRKSMIAKLPGRKNFMGEHLELVCLLQAAEIERLCEYLEEYKLKLREVERRELDRHSYEVQIKELTLRISEEGSFKAENIKLREFLRKQSSEFEELRKRIGTSTTEGELITKYQEALHQLEFLMQENQELKDSLYRMREGAEQGLAAKSEEIEELKRRLAAFQSGRGEASYKLEVEAKKLQFENKRLRENGQAKTRQLEEVQGKCKQLIYQFEEQAAQARHYANLTSTIQEYENRFSMVGQEIQRLNAVLRDKTQELGEVGSRCRGLEEERRRQNTYIAELEGRKSHLEEQNRKLQLNIRDGSGSMDESRTIIRNYESNLEKLSLEIERLNKVLRMKMGELEEAERRSSEFEYELRRSEAVKREVEEFRSKFSEFNRKMAEYENRIALSTQEIERLNQVLRRKNDEAGTLESQLRTRTDELDQLRNLYSHLEIEYNAQNDYLSKCQARVSKLEQETQLTAKALLDFKNYQNDSQTELQRLSALLASKNSEIERLQSLQSSRERDSTAVERHHLADLESELAQARQDNKHLHTNLEQYQSRILMLSQEIDRLNTAIRKGSPSLSPSRRSEEQLDPRKVTEYENKLAILSQEIDRLNDNLRTKDNKIKNYEQELGRRQGQPGVDSELAERMGEAEHRIAILTSQIERLNQVLKQKMQDSQNLEQKLRSSEHEAEDLRRKLVEYENTMQELNERAKGNLHLSAQYEIDGYKRKIAEQEKRLAEFDATLRDSDANYRSAIQQSKILEQQLRSQLTESTEGGRRISEYEAKIVALSKEVERLNTVLERFNTENQEQKRKLYEAEQLRSGINALQQRLALAAQENQQLRKRVNDGHQSTSKLNQDYESRIRQLSTEKEQATRRAQEQEIKLAGLAQELEYVNSVAKNKTDEFAILEANHRSLLQESDAINRKMQELGTNNRKIGEYEAKVALLSQEIERLNGILRAKLNDISELQSKCHGYELELSGYQRKVGDLENNITRELQGKNASLGRENEELKARVRQLSLETARVNEFENKLAMTLGEVERLNSILKGKLDEIEQLASRLRSTEADLERGKRRNDDLEATMHRELKNQSAVFEQRISQLSDENEAIRKGARGLSDANRQIPELENKLAIVSAEVDRLNSILLKYSRETVPALEEKTKTLTLECDEYRRKCIDLGQASKQATEAATRIKQLTQENEQQSRMLQEYEARMTFITAEIERLNGVLRSKVEELASSEAKLRQSQSEHEQLTKRYRDSSETVKRIPEYQSKLALMGQEMERLNGVLRSRGDEVAAAQSKMRLLEHELESLQRKHSDQETLIAQFKKQRMALEDRISAAASESDELRKSIRDLSDSNRRLGEYESRLTLLSQEVDRLNGNLRMKTDELAAAESALRSLKRESEAKLASLSAELEDYRRKASESVSSQATRLADYEGKMVVLTKEIERLNVVLKETTFELEGSRNREKQCTLEIERLNNTLRLKVEETTRWEQAHTELKAKLRSTEEALGTAHAQGEKSRQQHAQLTEEYKKSNQHMVEYEQSINKLYQEFERLQSIIHNLKKENYDLKVSVQEAGNLVQKNRVLSAEIDRLLKLIEQQTADLEELRLALADQSALQKRINEYMALMVVLFAEIESLRRRVKDTEKEIQDVRRSSLAPFKV